MSTALDLITSSMRLIGAVASGEVLTSNESTDGLNSLNQMLEDWSIQNLLIYSKTLETFPLIVSQQSYTMGSGGNFNTVRPLKIENAQLRTVSGSTNYDLPIEIINQDQWANISVKSTSSEIPTKLFVLESYPLATLYLWPTPSTANTLVLWSWKPLSSIASTNTTVNLPPGYARALKYNLALELAPEYGATPSETVVALALESRASIKRMNITFQLLSTDQALMPQGKGFNWLTGE